MSVKEFNDMLDASSISAVVQGGVFRPDEPTGLPDGTRVTLVVQRSLPQESTFVDRFARFEELRASSPINLGGEKFRREELYDRR